MRCWCLSAGSAVFHRLAKHFDVVIIDEAAQAVEPSVMVPLVMGCKQVTHSCLLQADHGSADVLLRNNNA
jgi:senataxin